MTEETPTSGAPGEPERLLESYISGDMDAFERLVALYEDRLYGFIERFTGDAHLAEDVFQIVFIKVANRAEAFDRRATFSTWLFRIARNAAIDELRKRRRGVIRFEGEPEERNAANPGASPSPLDALATTELVENIHVALALLPEAQREVFLLREEADLSFQEIGEIVGTGKETAKSRFRLAVEKVREILEKKGWTP